VRWKYHIPHVWKSPEDRTVWEDVYLMPEDGSMKGKSIWFTLNALTVGAAGLGNDFPDTAEEIREFNLRLLGDKDYFITLMIEKGVDLTKEDDEALPPLHQAVMYGLEDVVKAILESGADVNARSQQGNTPLVVAQTMKQDETAAIIKDHGGV
jgi:ankyrin repeat protein